MLEGMDRDRWLHTAALLAKIQNANATTEDGITSIAEQYPFDQSEEWQEEQIAENQKRTLERINGEAF